MSKSNHTPRIILASTSFRRQELMRWLGVPFEIVTPNFEEDQLHRQDFPSTAAFVEALSYGKALSVCDQFPDCLVISGDTLVDLNGEIIGKPIDLDHARVILKKLSDKTQDVFTGVTMIDTSTGKKLIQSDHSELTFRTLSDQEIEKYVQSGEPLGKAGAYAIHEGAASFMKELKGSKSNVVGFPLVLVVEMLKEFGVSVPVNVHNVIRKYLNFEE